MTTPNTLLAAARLAYPEIEWVITAGKVCIYELGDEFDPFGDKADAYALEGKLQDNAWLFFKVCDLWHGYHPEYKNEAFRDGHWVSESRENLLLICVETLEAMK